jgi:hypothetical protein
MKEFFRKNHNPTKARRTEFAQEIAGTQADPPLVVAVVNQVYSLIFGLGLIMIRLINISANSEAISKAALLTSQMHIIKKGSR